MKLTDKVGKKEIEIKEKNKNIYLSLKNKESKFKYAGVPSLQNIINVRNHRERIAVDTLLLRDKVTDIEKSSIMVPHFGQIKVTDEEITEFLKMCNNNTKNFYKLYPNIVKYSFYDCKRVFRV